MIMMIYLHNNMTYDHQLGDYMSDVEAFLGKDPKTSAIIIGAGTAIIIMIMLGITR